MARPRKNNVDYFSHDNNMRNDEKVLAIRRKFGFNGYAVWVMCLEKLYGGNNFQIILKDEIDWELLSGDFLIEPTLLKEIFNYFVSIDLLQKKGNIYYSKEVNRRVKPILDERERGREYINRRWKKADSIVIDTDNINNNELSVLKTIQSKVNESKVNISKDIHSSKTYKDFRDLRRIESGRPPMTPRKSTEKQKAFMAAAKSGIEYFKQQGQEQHGMQFLEYTNDKRNSIVLKLVMTAYEKIGDLKELIDWWFQGEGEWAEYEPEQCFSIKTIERFKNKQPKQKRGFIINKQNE